MNKKYKAKLKTAAEILGVETISINFDGFCFKKDKYCYTTKMNELAKAGTVFTLDDYPFEGFAKVFYTDVYNYKQLFHVKQDWLKDVKIVQEKAERKYPEFTESNVDEILGKCTNQINYILSSVPKHLQFLASGTPDEKIENFMNKKKKLMLKIVNVLAEMLTDFSCPFCEILKGCCKKCSYGKQYGECFYSSSSSRWRNVKKEIDNLKAAIEEYWIRGEEKNG